MCEVRCLNCLPLCCCQPLAKVPQGQRLNAPCHPLSLGLFLSPHPIVLPELQFPLLPSSHIPPLFSYTSCWKHLAYWQRSALQNLVDQGNKCLRFVSFVWFINVQEEPCFKQRHDLQHHFVCAGTTQQSNSFPNNHHLFVPGLSLVSASSSNKKPPPKKHTHTPVPSHHHPILCFPSMLVPFLFLNVWLVALHLSITPLFLSLHLSARIVLLISHSLFLNPYFPELRMNSLFISASNGETKITVTITEVPRTTLCVHVPVSVYEREEKGSDGGGGVLLCVVVAKSLACVCT